MFVKSISFPKEIWKKTFISRAKQFKSNLRHAFVDKDDNAKVNVPPDIPCTFLLFKASAFLQIFFPRKSKFWERQFFLMVNVWNSFTY